tara:strand:+ start:983 stop:1399 length:417 start_codon:yes stop_codon:yes gene_type:complete
LDNKISDKDKKDWENFLQNDEKLDNKDLKKEIKKFQKTRSLDLHGYTLVEANEEIERFIKKNYKEGVEKLIIVTGKGIHSQNEKDPYISKKLGILKYSIPNFIENNKSLFSIIKHMLPAKIEDGGEGAFYIYLKKNDH